MSRPIPSTRRKHQRGTWLMEFALCSIFLVPLFLATVGTGFTMSRAIQTTQLCRDAGHMFMDRVDFTSANNQKLIGRLSYGMGMSSDTSGTINTSGKGVVILTQIMKIGTVECAAGGYTTAASCPNYNRLVITQRVVVGNSSLRASNFGTPSTNIITSDGTIISANYCGNASALVPIGTAADQLNLQAGQYTFAAEAYVIQPELAGLNWKGLTGDNSTYAYNFF